MSLLGLKTNYRIEKISEMLLDQKIKAEIDRVYSFADIPEAMRYLGNNSAKGKIVIDIMKEENQ